MQQIDPLAKILFYMVVYIIFRLIRAVIQIESDLVALVKRLQRSEQSLIEIFTILTRFRLDKNDIPRETDFMLFNESFTTFEEICDRKWHIYNVSDSYVYLVRLPEDDLGSILEEPNQTDWIFSKGEKVARIGMDDFIIKASNLAPLKSKIVFMHSLPSAGGSLTAQLLQSTDASLKTIEVIGEPPVLTSLTVLSNTVSIEKMRAITRAVLRLVLLNFERGQTVIFQSRSCCSRLVPYVHISYPSIQHVFVTTRDAHDCVERLVEDHSAAFEIICRLMTYSPALVDFFFGWRSSELEAITNIGPENPYELALALTMGENISHQRNLKYFALDPIYFEDLLNDLHTVLRPLMDICEISDLALHECISFKRQEEVKFRRFSNVHSIPIEIHDRLKHLTDLLQQEWNR